MTQQSPSIFNIFVSRPAPVVSVEKKTTTIQTKIPDKSESVVKSSRNNIKENERLVKEYESKIQTLNTEILACHRAGKKQLALQKAGKVRKLNKQKIEIEQLIDKDEDNLFKIERTKIISNTHRANKELTEYQRDMMKDMDVIDVKEIQTDAIQMNGEMDYIFDAITGNDFVDENEELDENQAYLDSLMQDEIENDVPAYIEKQPVSKNNRINNMMRF